jgi:hypothetical protein
MATRSSVAPDLGLATRARVPSRASATRPDVDMFGMIATLCGAGLVVAVLLATYGLDLSVGFF